MHHSSLLQELFRPSFVLTIVLNPNLVNLGEIAYQPHSSLLQEFSKPSFVLIICTKTNLVNLRIDGLSTSLSSLLQELSRPSFDLIMF